VHRGDANACTGMQGLQDAYAMRALGEEHFGEKENHVEVASTDVIGVPLTMDIISKGFASLIPTKEERESYSFSGAILKTDLITKETCYEMIIDGKKLATAGD
ncbi:bifunctional ornithine acetyltransferase/N-acetylglutamate synthase, partial [Bacillus cereus]|uniref:bifunctional ornithine acetyltransferase/N-acetylglutamate synthase n=1 Tax=Bacillus cereus TaxID=1396 RepID=UPI002842F555